VRDDRAEISAHRLYQREGRDYAQSLKVALRHGGRHLLIRRELLVGRKKMADTGVHLERLP
jgi:hypothetical protein